MPEYDEGPVRATVVSQGFGTIEKTGTQYFALEVLPEGGAYPRTVKLWVNSEANLERAKARLMSLGWDGETWVAVNPDNPDGHSFVGLTLDLVNKHRDGFDDLDFPGPPGGGASGLKADVDLAKKLDRLGGKKANGRRRLSPSLSPTRYHPRRRTRATTMRCRSSGCSSGGDHHRRQAACGWGLLPAFQAPTSTQVGPLGQPHGGWRWASPTGFNSRPPTWPSMAIRRSRRFTCQCLRV